MANSYTYSSSLIEIPKDRHDQARAIIERITQECDEARGYVGFRAVMQHHGVLLLHADGQYFSSEQASVLVEALVKELSLPGIHVVSWADTCEEPFPDQFDGGAFAVQIGHATVWINAASDARKRAELLAQSGATTTA